jgi:hypothetical protein
MILYELKCQAGHVFEAWFKDSAAYDRQAKRGQIACPVCNDTRIGKAPMAPSIKGSKNRDEARSEARSEEAKVPAPAPAAAESIAHLGAMEAVRELVRQIEANCENVGDKFPDEARRIHYGESEKRGIYGQASLEETKALQDEGVEVAALPWVTPKRTN